MPPANSRKDGDKDRSAKSQEQELKRARGAISCAECRRLKLKCDKTVPCSSCKRRGCASICPNGSLTTGQGTRFILADTDRLHKKITLMSDRIRQLEDGLAILQASVARDAHPLLAPDLLKIKSGLELHSAAEGISAEISKDQEAEAEEEPADIDAFGTLAVRDDGAATFYGRSAGSESLLLDEKPTLSISTLSRALPNDSDLPEEIDRLASTFPNGPPDVPVIDLQDIVQSYLPPWARARQLRELYLEQAPWFFGAVTQRQLYDEVFPLFYEEAAEEARSRVAAGLVSSADGFNLPNTSATHASSHELALMLVVFCFGALTDAELPAAPHNKEAERYYRLTRAALSLEPVLDRPPSVATVQVLSLMAIYQGMVADEHSIEVTWSLMGLASKLAQSTGLHRDISKFKLSAAETQKRRALFWELFITDCWQALATGRLPTFELQFVDAELPGDPDETLAEDGTPQPSFPAWKARWGKECVYPVVMGTLTAQPPKYSAILELDRRLRDMALPKYAQGPPPRDAGLAQTMSHYMPTNYLHLTLLYVHRCFFASALVDHPTDPMRSQYAPSFLAGYRSASALLMTLREQFTLFPTQIARFWVLWTHAFSACVMMGSVVTRGGTTKTAQAALGELRIACDLFERAATHGGRAGKFVPILRKLREKAQAAYFQGLQPLRRDIFAPRTAESDQDELSIFSGRTPRTVATKSNRPQRISPSASTSTSSSAVDHSSPLDSQNGSDQSRSSQSPAMEVFPGLDSSFRTAVHPGLVEEMRSFQGDLDAQIHQTSAYYSQNVSMVDHSQQPQPQQQPHQLHPQQQQQYVGHVAVAVPPPMEQATSGPWYAMETDGQHSHHSSVSPPSSSASQSHDVYAVEVQYSHSHHQAHQQHIPEQQAQYHQHSQSFHQSADVPQTETYAHEVPVYGGGGGGEYAKAPDHAPGTAHYDNHPYAHVAANASQQSLHKYAGYTAVPDQRSELWVVDVPVSAQGQGGGGGGEDIAYHHGQAEYKHPDHAQAGGHGHGQPHAVAAHTQSHAHAHAHAYGQPHEHTHTHAHPSAQYQHPQPHVHQHPQHTAHPQAIPQAHSHSQALTQPVPLQAQHTGQSQHGNMHAQYVQGEAQYVYSQEHPPQQYQHQAHQHQHQHQYQHQHQPHAQAPVQGQGQQYHPQAGVVQVGYSLQDTWQTFFQNELPVPPGRR